MSGGKPIEVGSPRIDIIGAPDIDDDHDHFELEEGDHLLCVDAKPPLDAKPRPDFVGAPKCSFSCVLIVALLLAFLVFHPMIRLPVSDRTCPSVDVKVIALNSVYPRFIGHLSGLLLPGCPAQCRITTNISAFKCADAIVWNLRWMTPVMIPPSVSSKRPNQRWVFNFFFEAPIYQNYMVKWHDILQLQPGIDWTMTYRNDSDFFQPYSRFGPLSEAPYEVSINATVPAVAKKKQHLLLWIVSRCEGERMEYWQRLAGHLPSSRVHIYGKCGEPMPCRKSTGMHLDRPSPCEEELFGKYKFYAAFENSRCGGYITEKFAKAIHFGMVPVVIGGARADYEALAPANSFLHVDDFSSTWELADHLLLLDSDDTAYNRMLAWRSQFYLWPETQRHVQPFCDLCAELHKPRSEQKPSIGSGLYSWWFYGACRQQGFPHN